MKTVLNREHSPMPTSVWRQNENRNYEIHVEDKAAGDCVPAFGLKIRAVNTGWLCYPLAESRNWGRFRQRVDEERDEKCGKPVFIIMSLDTRHTTAPHSNIAMRV